MNEMNPLETQLRSWTPRRPSVKLERRLFGRKRSAPQSAAMLGWLLPATACFLFVCLLSNPENIAPFADQSQRGRLVALSLSNQSYAPFLPGSFQRTANRLDSFEWTNGGSSTSSLGSLSPARASD